MRSSTTFLAFYGLSRRDWYKHISPESPVSAQVAPLGQPICAGRPHNCHNRCFPFNYPGCAGSNSDGSILVALTPAILAFWLLCRNRKCFQLPAINMGTHNMPRLIAGRGMSRGLA